VSVLQGGGEGKINFNDFDLKRSYSVRNAASHAITATSLMFQHLAAKNPNISFIHIAPGYVSTDIASGLPWYARILATPLTYFATPVENCAQYMIYASTAPQYTKPGCHLVGSHGQPVPPGVGPEVMNDENRNKVWKLSNALLALE
jgi:hypothetical protein